MSTARGGIRVEGLNSVVRGLVASGIEVDDLKSSFSKIAAKGAQLAANAAPLGETGNLRASVRGSKARNKAVVSAGRAAVPYAGVINYGWRAHNISPSGFMQKADGAIQPYALRVLEVELNLMIRRNRLL